MVSEQHRRILLVDDDSDVRELLGRALRHRALHVDEASDGDEAIALLRDNSYSVVLLDLVMPHVDGFGVLETIDGDSGAAPVVMVITGADRRVLDQLDCSKIHGIIRKPFDAQEIAVVVAACADIRGRSAFETMALATMMSGAPLIALLKL